MRVLGVCIFLSFTLFSCKSDPREKFLDSKPQMNHQEQLIAMQKQELKRDSLAIKSFLEKNTSNYSETGTGLRYEITKSTELDKVQSGMRVIFKYNMSNLKGETLYSSNQSGYMDMMVDFSQAETGLHELLKKMRYGEEARAVIPYHLGHGIAGDDYKIPPFTSIVMELKILI